MSELPGLFYDYPESHVEDADESHSAFSKLLLALTVLGLVGAGGAIAYFGVGPMLAKPYAPAVQSSAPDVAEVLGLNDARSNTGISEITDNEQRQPLLQRLAAEVDVPEGEEVSVLLVEQVPQHTPTSLFAQASNGDILFILMQTGMAYLYRPSQNTIIASGSVSAE